MVIVIGLGGALLAGGGRAFLGSDGFAPQQLVPGGSPEPTPVVSVKLPKATAKPKQTAGIEGMPTSEVADQHSGPEAEPDPAHEAGDDESGQGPG